MNLNSEIIDAVTLGKVNFSEFDVSLPMSPNLNKSLAAVRLFRGLLLSYHTRPKTSSEWKLFLEWAIKSKMLTQQSKTWRITKSRLKNIFEHPEYTSFIDQVEQELLQTLDIENIESPGTNSTKKAKFIPLHISSALIKFLKNSKSSNAEHAIRWLQVSLLTGMRGIEWTKTELHENNDYPFLRIVNTTKGSPFSTSVNPLPPIRLFPLNHVSHEDVLLIKEHLHFIKSLLTHGGLDSFHRHYEMVSNLIYTQNHKLPDEARSNGTYGIYSCRHQVIANLKASNKYSMEQIGRMMGQSTRRVTERTYAKAKVGYVTELPNFPEDES